MNNFQNFTQYSGINSPGIFSNSEERNSAVYTFSQFKNILRAELYEAEEYVDDLILEEAYSYYEISSFLESKGNWISNPGGSIMYLDAGENVILIKESDSYIISKSTFEAINENKPGMFDRAKGAWNKMKAKTTSAISSMSAGAKKAWNAMSDGAKKAWAFVKTIPSVVTKMVKNMGWKEWTSLTLGVISALCGLVGAGVPGVTILGGCSMVLLGAMDIWDGWGKYTNATKKLGKLNLSNFGKDYSLVTAALPEIATGTLLLSLGIKDVLQGSTTALANPSAGSVSLAVKAKAMSASKSTVASLGKNASDVTAVYIKNVVQKVSKNPKLSSKIPNSVGKIAVMSLGNLVLSKTLDWLFRGIMKGADLLLSAFNFLVNIPEKISGGIEKFRKEAKSSVAKIVSKGLATLVKPLTDSATRMINKHIKPLINGAKAWIKQQIASYDLCVQTLKEVEKKNPGKKIADTKVPPSKGKPFINPKAKAASIKPNDVKMIKKIKSEKKVNESESFYNIYNFDQFLRLA
jgi:hypothetical protein